MTLLYPAIFSPCGAGGAYTVEFPDLPGCAIEGSTLDDAIVKAENAAAGWVLGELEAGKTIPAASEPSSIRPEAPGFLSFVALDMDAYAEKHGAKSVRKNLTIPAWLNTFAEGQHINFSQVLTDALTAIYQKQVTE